ncbi:MAG: zinc metalloprotease HtpX [Methanocellales archaeon]
MKKWYGRDIGLTARMFLTMFLLGLLYLAFIAVLFYFEVNATFIFTLAAILLGIQYFFSDKLVLLMMGAKIVSESEAPQLHNLVERLCALSDLPKPKIAIVESSMPNAFATGRNPRNAVVAVTTGIMRTLNKEELEGVLAHELSHIKNRDVLVITIASFISTVAFYIMRMFMFSAMLGGVRRERNGGALVIIYIVSAIVWAISFFLIRALSRYREFAADRGSAIITGRPSHLISALLKISGQMERVPQRDLRAVEGMNQFFIVPAISGRSLLELFSTHPSIEKRIARLEAMERSM